MDFEGVLLLSLFSGFLGVAGFLECIFSGFSVLLAGELFVIFNDLKELTVDWLVFLVNRFSWLILVGFEFGEVGIEEHFLRDTDFLIFSV